MSELVVGSCEVCGRRRFPKPLWCPSCGSDRIRDAPVRSGLVEEATVIRHVAGRDLPHPVTIGSVRVSSDVVVIARLETGVGEGDRVELDAEGGAPVARRAGR